MEIKALSGLLLAVPSNPSTLVIDSFLVSCRALGRGVEDALWAAMMQQAYRQKVQRLEAVYLPTPKNVLVAELYDRSACNEWEPIPPPRITCSSR